MKGIRIRLTVEDGDVVKDALVERLCNLAWDKDPCFDDEKARINALIERIETLQGIGAFALVEQEAQA